MRQRLLQPDHVGVLGVQVGQVALVHRRRQPQQLVLQQRQALRHPDEQDLLDANFQDGDSVDDFVQLEQSGADVQVQVDSNGPSGGANFVDVAVLSGYGTSNADIVRVVFENQTQQLSA